MDSPSTNDRTSFEALVRRYQNAVCAMAFSILRDRARSEEVAQDAFLVAWQQHREKPVSAAWICGIARNLARNAARRRKEVTMAHEPAGCARDPEAVLIADEDVARATAALAKLPEPYRDAIVVYYRGDESMAEVAEALGISQVAAKQRVHRAREKLRAALGCVETALRATRPGAAFTAAVLLAWTLRGGAADAATMAVATASSGGGFTAGGWFVALLAAAALATTATVVVVTRSSGDFSDRADPVAAAELARRKRAEVRARFPAMPGLRKPPPADYVALEADAPATNGATAFAAANASISLDFQQAPAPDLLRLVALRMDTPILFEGDFDDGIDIRLQNDPALHAFDEILGKATAQRTEVAAVRLVFDGGRLDAAVLGGDPMSLQVRDAPLHDILSLVEAKLHMPVSRLAMPEHPPCTPGTVEVDGRKVEVRCGPSGSDGQPYRDPSPRVTIDVVDMPAGAVLELVLAQTGLRYELTTGFVISPAT